MKKTKRQRHGKSPRAQRPAANPLTGKPAPEYRKVTLLLPSDLLEKATRASKEGITPTIRQGLELVAASGAYEWLRAMRGKIKFSIDLKTLRED